MLMLAAQAGVNLEVDNIDDTCYGMVIDTDKSFNDVLVQHAALYNYQIIDGDPVRISRRALNEDLTIDYEINQVDCVTRNGSPAVSLKRSDSSGLPRQIEIQYIDPDRLFAETTQYARHPGAPTTNGGASYRSDFIITASQARAIAYDLLYRIWSQQLSLTFEHKDLTIEPGDTLTVTTERGTFTCIVIEATYTAARTNMISAVILLSSVGVSLSGGAADSAVTPNSTIDGSSALVAGTP
jgi:Putative phage tail protein